MLACLHTNDNPNAGGVSRANICFGKPFNEDRFRMVLHACCLEMDLATMELSDLTVVGDDGITLSGGQKQRVSLARAVYADADVYLMVRVHAGVLGVGAGSSQRQRFAPPSPMRVCVCPGRRVECCGCSQWRTHLATLRHRSTGGQGAAACAA